MSAPAASSPGALFVDYLLRLEGDSSSSAANAAAASSALQASQSHAVRLLCALVCEARRGDSLSTAHTSWTVVEAVWAEVQSRITALQQLHAQQPQRKQKPARDEDPSASDKSAGRGKKKQQQQQSRGKGGKLPAAQAAQLERAQEALALQRRINLFLQALRVLLAWMHEQNVRAATDERVGLVLRAAAGTMELLRADSSSSHAAAVGLLCVLSRMSAPLQTQLQECCLAALQPSVAAVSSSASSSAALSAANAHPAPLTQLLCALLEGQDAFAQRVWTAAMQMLQSGSSAALRQQILRTLLPPLLAQDASSQSGTASLTTLRLQELAALYRALWNQGLQLCGLSVEACDVRKLSPFALSPLVAEGFLQNMMTQVPQLVHLFDALCAFYPAMFEAVSSSTDAEAPQSSFNAWMLDVVLAGLASGHAVYKKQAVYLLQVRQALREQRRAAGAPEDASSADEYTPEQWTCFQQLFHSLDGTSLHLMQSVFPRIEWLLCSENISRAMDPFLELLVSRAVLHNQPSIASTSFQQLYAICSAPGAEAISCGISAAFVSPRSLFPPRLRPAVVLGPILKFFDDPSLFGVDKERSGTRRVGDTLLGPFLVDYIQRLPFTRFSATCSSIYDAPCTRAEFMRAFLAWLGPVRATWSVGALGVQMRALASVDASHCLDESDIALLLALMQNRLAVASSRLRPFLTVSCLQVLARHADLSQDISAELLSRLLLEFPSEWMRPGCSALKLLQQSLHPLSGQAGWLERRLPRRIDELFDGLAAALVERNDGSDDASSAASADVPASKKESTLLVADGADLLRAHDGLLRLLLLVRDNSVLEARILEHLGSRIDACFALVSSPQREFVSTASPRATLSLLQLLHFLGRFIECFTRSRLYGLEAARTSPRPELETICLPEGTGSAAFLDDDEKETTASMPSASSWERRLRWAEALVARHGLACVDLLHALVSAAQQSSDPATESSRMSAALQNVMESLLRHEALKRFKHSLLASLVLRLFAPTDAAASATTTTDKPLTYGLLTAAVCNCSAEEWDSAATATALQCGSNEEQEAILQWAKATSASSASFAASSSLSSPLLPQSLSLFLCNHVVNTSTLGKKPSHVDNNSWKRLVQEFHLNRWRAAHHILSSCPGAREILGPSLLDECVSALDGCTIHFVEHVFNAVRLLMPSALRKMRENGSSTSDILALAGRIYSNAWTSFKDLVQDFPSYTCTLAFLGIVFEPCFFSIAENHLLKGSGDGDCEGPFRTQFNLLLDYGAFHSRLMVYLALFATAAWSRFPRVLPLYARELQKICCFRADGGSEVVIIEEKFKVFEVAHMIHQFSAHTHEDDHQVTADAVFKHQTDQGRVVKEEKLRRGESLVRAVGLVFVEHLPSLIAALPLEKRSVLHEFVFSFATLLVSDPRMQNDKGSMLGEGNDDFVVKAYLWQTLCILVPSIASCAGARSEELHQLLEKHTWEWFLRPLTSVLRQLLEVFLSSLYARAPHRISAELAPKLMEHMARPTLLASLVVILAFATLGIEDFALKKEQARRTLRVLHPFVGSNFGHVRLVVQYLYHRLVTELGPPEWQANAGEVDGSLPSIDGASSSSSSSAALTAEQVRESEETSCISRMMSFLSLDPDLVRLRARQHEYFLSFSPFRGVTVGGLMAHGDEAHHWLHQPVLDAITKLQGEYLSGLRGQYDDKRFPVKGSVCIDQSPASSTAAQERVDDASSEISSLSIAESSTSAAPASAAAAEGAPNFRFQQKIEVTPLTQLTALGDLTQDAAMQQRKHEEGAGDEEGGPQGDRLLRSVVEQRSDFSARSDIIVIASLVSKLPNLAGLLRTCEIFQAGKLMVADANVVNCADFQAIAVTAHRWMKMESLPPADVCAFLRARQSEGYACLALEQSACSIPLPNFQFPRRCVILLGAEKEGVPVDMMNLVDYCVEIPQKGIIRSLNVHVSASILLWEYTRQDMLGLIAE